MAGAFIVAHPTLADVAQEKAVHQGGFSVTVATNNLSAFKSRIGRLPCGELKKTEPIAKRSSCVDKYKSFSKPKRPQL